MKGDPQVDSQPNTAPVVQAAALALEHGWAINLGGGMHHARFDHGEGWYTRPNQLHWQKQSHMSAAVARHHLVACCPVLKR
jgi:hypothetical protein